MDPLLMVGAWAAAILSLAGTGRLLWKAFVKGVSTVIDDSIRRVWVDMDDIERRLDRLEEAVSELQKQVGKMTDLLMAHVAEMTRRHD
ncbi:MAG TPA: hypothetical protein VIG24_15670 [Acidimicrobiia bacterium]